MRLHSEKQACPRRRNLTALKMALSRCQTERDGKAFGDTEQSDRHLTGCWDSCVASEALCPREASMGALGARQDHFCVARRSCGGRRQAPPDALVAQELRTGPPMRSAAP